MGSKLDRQVNSEPTYQNHCWEEWLKNHTHSFPKIIINLFGPQLWTVLIQIGLVKGHKSWQRKGRQSGPLWVPTVSNNCSSNLATIAFPQLNTLKKPVSRSSPRSFTEAKRSMYRYINVYLTSTSFSTFIINYDQPQPTFTAKTLFQVLGQQKNLEISFFEA